MNNDLFFIFFNLSNYPVIAHIGLFLSYPMVLIFIVCLMLWVISTQKDTVRSLLLLGFSGMLAWCVVVGLKFMFMIPRPFLVFDITPLFFESTYSFPSNHAASISALAFTIFSMNKKTGSIAGIIAFLIGLSRIVIGVHTPLDVFAGFCVGIIASFICSTIFKKI